MGTKEGFTTTVLSSVPPLKPDGNHAGRELVIADYDRFFHAPVNKHLKMLEKVLEYAFRGAKNEETKSWPKPGYGKDKDFGINRILLTSMQPYQDNFVNRLGMDEIKAYKSHEELIRELRKVNDDLANKAAKLRADESEIAPAVKLDEVVERLAQKRAAPRVEHTKDGPRDARLPMTPANRTSRYPGQGYSKSGQSGARNSMLDTDDSLLDVTANCDNPLWSPGSAQTFSPERETDEDGWGVYPDEEELGSLNAMLTGRGNPSGTQKLYDPKARIRDPTRGCWKHFENRNCPGNCGWDHSNEAMQKLARERVAIVLNSPYVALENLRRELDKKDSERARSPRNASLSMVFGGNQSDVDTSAVVEGITRMVPPDLQYSVSAELARISGFQPEVTLSKTPSAPSSASKGSS